MIKYSSPERNNRFKVGSYYYNIIIVGKIEIIINDVHDIRHTNIN